MAQFARPVPHWPRPVHRLVGGHHLSFNFRPIAKANPKRRQVTDCMHSSAPGLSTLEALSAPPERAVVDQLDSPLIRVMWSFLSSQVHRQVN